MKIRVKNLSPHHLPEQKTEFSSGLDLRAYTEEPINIGPGETTLVKTGLFLEIPQGYEGQVRPRSGLAFKHGITVLNSPGTIDADYRGEIKVLLINHSKIPFSIESGDRIAQLVIAKHEKIEWEESEILEESMRSEGGFGSTGKN
jgi:dUTP diphosphatase